MLLYTMHYITEYQRYNMTCMYITYSNQTTGDTIQFALFKLAG